MIVSPLPMGHFFMEITCLEATLSYINKSNDLSDWYQLYFPTDLSYLLSVVYIDSLDGFTFQNQLMSIMLVMATGQHLHTIIS